MSDVFRRLSEGVIEARRLLLLPVMRSSLPVVAMCLLGCATQRETGQAMVGAGALVAVVASEAATDTVDCTPTGCRASTSRNTDVAAAGVGAGIGLAVVGAALSASDPGDHLGTAAAAPPRAGS